MSICDYCKKEITGKAIVISDSILSGTYCSDCRNRVVSECLGIDFEHIKYEPVQMKDSYGKKHTFYFETDLLPVGRSIEAFECVNKGGYTFSILGELNCDPRALHAQLLDRIRKALRLKHLERNKWNKSFFLKDIVRGRIDYDQETDAPAIVIDGRSFSLDEFGRMLMSYEGFQFRLEIIDRSEDVK